MERWAANTLRTLGIILIAGVVLIGSLFLLLLSMCAAQGDFGGNKHPDQVVPYLVAAGLVAVLGCLVIVRLARGIFRSKLVAEPAAAGAPVGMLPHSEPTPSLPLHLSPLGRQAIDRLVFALGAQVVLSALSLSLNVIRFWSARRVPAYHGSTLVLIVSFVLSHAPYVVLIYVLLKRPDRRAFAYALAMPAVLVLQSLFVGVGFIFFYTHNPIGFLFFLLPWLIHIVIIVFAYQAIQQVGLHPEPSSLIVAAVVSFLFFSLINAVTPFLYRFTPR
jgi:hypothetical protein